MTNKDGVSTTETPTRSWRWRVASAAGLAVYLCLMLWWFASPMRGPIIFGDENGPIEIARTLSGQQLEANTRFFPGHSLVLLPSVIVGNTPYGEYRLALITNVVVIAAAALVLFFALCSKLDVAPWRVAVGVAAAFSVPYVTSSAALLWSESSLIAVAAVLTALVLHYSRTRHLLLVVLIGVGSGAAFLFHPRFIAAVPAALVGIAVATPRGEAGRLRAVLIGGVGALGGFLASWQFRAWVISQTSAVSAYRDRTFRFERGWDLVADVTGSVIGRLGTDVLALVALPVIALALPPARKYARTLWPAVLFACVFALLQLLYTAYNFAQAGIQRTDWLYYTRYQGPAMVMLAAVSGASIAAVASKASLFRWKAHALLLGLLAVGALALSVLIQASDFKRAVVSANIPELGFLGAQLDPLPVFAVVAIVGAALLGLSQLPVDRTVGVVACLVVGLVLSSFWFARSAHPGSVARSAERALVPYLQALDKEDCVLFDPDTVHFWNRGNYEFFSDARFRPFDSDRGSDCGPLLIVGQTTSIDIDPRAELLGTEPVRRLELYRLP